MKGLIIDCFAGGGGASVGIEMALGRPVDIAINHDPDAILMHKTNHPNTLPESRGTGAESEYRRQPGTVEICVRKKEKK